MPAERLSMRKVREVLRLKHVLGMSYRKISEATGVGKTQAAEYVRRAEAAGMTWPVPPGIDDAELDRLDGAGDAYHVSGRAWRSAPRAFEDLLGCSYLRKVARDNTVSVPGRWVQLPPRAGGRSWQGCTVEVRECLDGSAIVFHRELVIVRQAAPPGPFTLVQREGGQARGRCPENFAAPHVLTPKEPVPAKLPDQTPRRRPPAAEHPWNRSYKLNHSNPARAGGRT